MTCHPHPYRNNSWQILGNMQWTIVPEGRVSQKIIIFKEVEMYFVTQVLVVTHDKI